MPKPCRCGAKLADCYVHATFVCFDCAQTAITLAVAREQERDTRWRDPQPWTKPATDEVWAEILKERI